MEDLRRQEIHCHNCNQYVQFDLDVSLNGRHVLNCPNCGHEHCRVVKDGVITDERWATRNGWQPSNMPTITVTSTTITSSGTSTFDIYGSTGTTNYYMYQSWMNAGTRS